MGHAVAAADRAVRTGLVSLAALTARAQATRGPGSLQIRCLAALCDPSADSAIESLLRVAIVVSGLPVPCSQWRVATSLGDLRVDFAWPPQLLIVEVDGFAYHSDRESYRKDRDRTNQLQLLGWRVLRFTWEDIIGRPDWVVAQIAAALAA